MQQAGLDHYRGGGQRDSGIISRLGYRQGYFVRSRLNVLMGYGFADQVGCGRLSVSEVPSKVVGIQRLISELDAQRSLAGGDTSCQSRL